MKPAFVVALFSLFALSVQAQQSTLAQQSVVQVECRDLGTTGNYLAPNETLINGKACRPAGTPLQASQAPTASAETPKARPPAPQAATAQTTTPAATGTATVYFYRPHRFQGAALKPSVYIDQEKVTQIHSGEAVKVVVPAGQHQVYSNDKATGTNLDAEAGKTYYVRIDIQTGFWKGHGGVTLVDPQEGEYESSQTKLSVTRDLD